MNKNYEAFRNSIMYAIRTSGLELGAIFYVLKDIMSEVERLYSNAIQQEFEAEKQAQLEAEQKAKEEAESVGLDDNTEEDIDL